MPVLIPRSISDDSWLHEPRFKDVLAALRHAGTKTRAIPALSKIDPEEAAHLFLAMYRGWLKAREAVASEKLLDTHDPDDVVQHDLSREQFPFTVAATDEDTGELLWFQRVEGPTGVHVPGFAPRQVAITITGADGETSIMHADGTHEDVPAARDQRPE